MADSRERLILEMQAEGGAATRAQVGKVNDSVEQMSETTEGVGAASDKAKAKFGEMALKIVGLSSAAGVAIGGIARNLDQQDIGAKLQAQLGLSDSSTAQIAKDVGSVYAQNFGESFDDVGDAMRSAIQNGFANVDDGSNVTAAKALLGIKSGLGAEADEVSHAVGSLLKNGLAKNAGQAFDLITAGFQKGANNSGEFLDSLNEYAVQFKAVGFSARDFTNTLVLGNKKGAFSIDKVGDAVKEFAVRAVDGSTTTATGFQMIGLDAKKTGEAIAQGGPVAKKTFQEVARHIAGLKDPLKRQQAGVALFGTQWEDIRGKAILALGSTENALGKTTGATDALIRSLGRPLRAQLEGLRRAFMAALGEGVRKSLVAIVKGAGYVVDQFRQGNPVVIVTAGVLGTLTAVLTAQALAFGVVTAATTVWAGVTNGASLAVRLLNASLLANPFVLVGALIVGVGLAIWQLWKRNEAFRRGVQQAWATVKQSIGAVVAWIKPKFADFKAAMASVFNWLAPKVALVFGIVKKEVMIGVSIVKWYVTAWKNVLTFFVSLPGRVSRAVSGLWDGLKNGFKDAINWIIRKWNDFHLTIGGGKIAGVSIPGVTLNTPNIPTLYTGGEIKRSGMAMVGERGPELVRLPTGSTVYDAQQSAMAMHGARGMTTKAHVTWELKGGTHEMRLLAKLITKSLNVEIAHA